MNAKALVGYLLVLGTSFLLYSTGPRHTILYASLPALMLTYPIIAGHRVKLRFSLHDILWGIGVSAVILIPYWLILGNHMHHVAINLLIFQLLGIALPEEFFFRGFLQDSMGRSGRSILLTSLLFALAHLPKAIFWGEWISLLSFFPSLVMGWLFMKRQNILPGTIFHFLANLVQHF